jgi:hypothetical protein
VSLSAGLDYLEKRKFLTLQGLELLLLGRPTGSQSLYIMRRPDSLLIITETISAPCKELEASLPYSQQPVEKFFPEPN